MATISVRVPDELEQELDTYIEAENLDQSTAVRKLLIEGIEAWRIDRALDLLETGEVSFSRAAELADVSVWKLSQLVEDRNVTWVHEDDIEADLAAAIDTNREDP